MNLLASHLRPAVDQEYSYGTAQSISEAYSNASIGSAFSCADNSGTVV